MRHGSLFSGGGGFDLAAELMGWNTVFHSEIDPFCNRILQYYWPSAESIGDIKNFDATPFKGKIDIITGGFPCQPFSSAGKRRGTSDNRHLWPEMLRIIGQIKPAWVVGENVYGILTWNGGMVFYQVHTDLEALGYEVRAFLLPACGVNAPHRRYRVWFVAHATPGAGCKKKYPDSCKRTAAGFQERHNIRPQLGRHGAPRDAANADGPRLERRPQAGNTGTCWEDTFKQFARQCKRGYWNGWPTEPALCRGDDGLPAGLDGITLPKWRKESIKMYGNAIVPQVALQIFKAIEQTEAAEQSPPASAD